MLTTAKFSVAALALATSSAIAAQDAPVEANSVSREFYGVPLKLHLRDLEQLSFSSKLGWGTDEGVVFPTAKIKVSKAVTLDAAFDQEGYLYELATSSRGAKGPRGIAVGSSLTEVKKAWPKGELVWGIAHGRYVTFDTGAGIYYQFSPAALAPEAWNHSPKNFDLDPSIKVIEIRFVAREEEQ